MAEEYAKRYESRGGRYWVERTYADIYGMVDYRSDNGGGRIHVSEFRRRLEAGEFQADANVTPMRRVR